MWENVVSLVKMLLTPNMSRLVRESDFTKLLLPIHLDFAKSIGCDENLLCRASRKHGWMYLDKPRQVSRYPGVNNSQGTGGTCDKVALFRLGELSRAIVDSENSGSLTGRRDLVSYPAR